MTADNVGLARRLDEVATLLNRQAANPYRVRAYRNAAVTLRELRRPAAQVYREEGLTGLERLSGTGESIARSLRALLTTGRLPMLERLRGASDPEELLMTVPGIGRKTAELLHAELGIDSLEALEIAAYDGRLASLAGIRHKRLEGIRDLLATRLGRAAGRELGARSPGASPRWPSCSTSTAHIATVWRLAAFGTSLLAA